MTRQEKFANTTSLAELMTMATDDMEALMYDERYMFNSSFWHSYDTSEEDCAICASGAVMANSLKIEPTIHCTPGICTEDIAKRLRAIDTARRGYLATAYQILGQFHDDALWMNVKDNDFVGTESAQKFIEFWRDEGIPKLNAIEAEITT